MTDLEKAQRVLGCIKRAIAHVKYAADEERRLTHTKHVDPDYQAALDHLDLKLTGVGAREYRLRMQAHRLKEKANVGERKSENEPAGASGQ